MTTRYQTVIESMFRIVDRFGVTQDFILKPQQRMLDECFTRRNIIPKGRQGAGVSSYMIARFTAKCLAEQNKRCVIVSHETDATARLLNRARYILTNLKGDLKPVLGTDSQKSITFPKTNSSLWIGTAGSRKFGRGDTISDLHLSEVAQYDDPEEFMKGILPAAEHGEVTLESTGNGVGNYYHRQCVRARDGRGFRLFFFPSHEMADNRIPFESEAERDQFMSHLSEELEEPAIVGLVTLEFLKWRRERLEVDFEGDLRAFRQEHPITFDECFQSTGFSFFQKVLHVPTSAWQRESRELHVLRDHPRPALRYCIGADVGGGVGRDNSVAQILCLDPLEQVGEWVSGYREPDEFGRVLGSLGRRFNHAYVNVERNNHGMTTLRALLDDYEIALVHRGSHGADSPQVILSHLNHFGTQVTEANRGTLLGHARRILRIMPIHSEGLKSELGTFVEQKNGKIEADSGCFDDRVMALVHAAACVERAQIVVEDEARWRPDAAPDPFSWEAIFGSHLSGSRDPLPISRERFG
jgi:hypothetical protein